MGADKLVSEIEAFSKRAGISPSTFGKRALNDGKFVKRLQRGGRCWPETVERAHRFMRENEPDSGQSGTQA